VKGNFKPFILQGYTIGFPGMAGWAYKTKSLLIGDQDTLSGPAFLQVRASGKVIGITRLSCSSGYCDVVQGTVNGKYLIAPDAESLVASVFPYPAGGDALVTVSGFGQPIGSAVSSVKNE
jgi:hypothetical protein